MDLIFYDTETTGTDPTFDQILQFAAVRNGCEIERSRSMRDTVPDLAPCCAVPWRATR